MVATPVSSETVAPTGDVSRSTNVSLGSIAVSPFTVTETVLVRSSVAKLSGVVGRAT